MPEGGGNMRLYFKKNLGDMDRIIRLIIGVALVWLASSQYVNGGWATLALVLGLSQFIESAFAY